MTRRAAGGSVAEQPAGRDAGIGEDVFQRADGGKARSHFPRAHRGKTEPEPGGHHFAGDAVFKTPASQDVGKIRTQTAGRSHGTFLAPNAGREKLFLPAICAGGATINLNKLLPI